MADLSDEMMLTVCMHDGTILISTLLSYSEALDMVKEWRDDNNMGETINGGLRFTGEDTVWDFIDPRSLEPGWVHG